MGLGLSLFFGFLPMFLFAWLIYWLDRYEKEPLLLLGGVFTWGAIFAAGAAFVANTLLGYGVMVITGSENTATLTTGSIIAPLVEESLKGLAVLAVFLVFHYEFDSIMDGIVYAAVTALGFAATENVYYIYEYGYSQNGFLGLAWMVFVRVILVGWQHPFYTAFLGIGLAVARLSLGWPVRLLAPLAAFALAVATHSIHNTLASILHGLGGFVTGTLFDWSGWLLMLLFIFWAVQREQKWLAIHLREEVALGMITPAQYLMACSTWKRSRARWGALLHGQFHTTSRFYQLCSELAQKKQQLLELGDEDGNLRRVQQLRQDLAQLSQRLR